MTTRTTWEGAGWSWSCDCGAREDGFVMEHHARTIADQHALVHSPDLTASSFAGPVESQGERDPIVAQLILHSVEREPRKVTV